MSNVYNILILTLEIDVLVSTKTVDRVVKRCCSWVRNFLLSSACLLDPFIHSIDQSTAIRLEDTCFYSYRKRYKKLPSMVAKEMKGEENMIINLVRLFLQTLPHYSQLSANKQYNRHYIYHHVVPTQGV